MNDADGSDGGRRGSGGAGRGSCPLCGEVEQQSRLTTGCSLASINQMLVKTEARTFKPFSQAAVEYADRYSEILVSVDFINNFFSHLTGKSNHMLGFHETTKLRSNAKEVDVLQVFEIHIALYLSFYFF